MTTNNAANQKYDNNSDGWDLAGGTTARKLIVTGADMTLTGSGTNVYTFPAATDTLVGRASTDTLTNKTLTTPVLNGTPTGTGVATAATASTLVLRDASANESSNSFIPGFTTTATAAGTTTLTITSTQTQQFTGSTTQTVKLPTTGVVAGQMYKILNSSSGLVTVQSSGANTIYVQASGVEATYTALVATPTTSGNWYCDNDSAQSAQGKLGFFNNSLTLSGTDGTTLTFPSTSATIARTDAANTFTGAQTFSTSVNSGSVIVSNNAITASANAATVPITAMVSTVTNNSAATLTVTMTTGAANRQLSEVLILDSSAAAQTITWVNTENSTVTVPATSNGSTTLPLSVLFQYNAATTKWRCIASA